MPRGYRGISVFIPIAVASLAQRNSGRGIAQALSLPKLKASTMQAASYASLNSRQRHI